MRSVLPCKDGNHQNDCYGDNGESSKADRAFAILTIRHATLRVIVPLRAHRSRDRHNPDCHQSIVYQFWLVRGGGNGGWGRAKPIVPSAASVLALRVSTLRNIVKEAARTAITKAVAKIANTVRWVFIVDPPTPPNRRLPWQRHYDVDLALPLCLRR